MKQTPFETLLKLILNHNTSLSPDMAQEKIIVFSADADRIQSYIFESSRLPEIRGASRLLSEINEERACKIIREKLKLPEELDPILFAGGGSLLALLPNDMQIAEALKKALSKLYLSETIAATVTIYYQAFTLQQLREGLTLHHRLPDHPFYTAHLERYIESGIKGFGEVMAHMSLMLKQCKQARELMPFADVLPFVQRCVSCQFRSAEIQDRDGDLLCSVCDKKRRPDGNKKAAVHQRSYWFSRLLNAGVLPEVYNDYPDLSYPQDIEMLVSDDDLAFVYADGDGIGKKLNQFNNPGDYKTFSQTLKNITLKAVGRALGSHKSLAPVEREYENRDGKTERQMIHPWEIITIGGDDVLILIPAAAAIDFSVMLARSFKDLSETSSALKALGIESLSMSVGFATGKPSTPIRLLNDVADKAKKNAKRRRHDLKSPQPCIDFHSFVKEGFYAKNLREKTLVIMDNVLLTGRPYTLEDMEKLQKSLQYIQSDDENEKRFPKSQIYNLCMELRRGQVRGSIYYYYQRSRLKSIQHTLQQIETVWDSRDFPWVKRQDDTQYPTYTMWLDIMSLL